MSLPSRLVARLKPCTEMCRLFLCSQKSAVVAVSPYGEIKAPFRNGRGFFYAFKFECKVFKEKYPPLEGAVLWRGQGGGERFARKDAETQRKFLRFKWRTVRWIHL